MKQSIRFSAKVDPVAIVMKCNLEADYCYKST